MTQREIINQEIIASWKYFYLSVFFWGVGIIALQFIDQTISIWIPLIGFILFPVYFYKVTSIKCKKCLTSFNQSIYTSRKIFLIRKISEKLKFCPHCGASLDENI